MEFRYSFRELIKGKHPDRDDWLVSRNRRLDLDLLGQMPPRGGWSYRAQDELSKIIAQASIDEISKVVGFPDWVGFLGLGFCYCEHVERSNRRLTLALVPQLIILVDQNSDAYSKLNDILNSDKLILHWGDLELVEKGIEQNK